MMAMYKVNNLQVMKLTMNNFNKWRNNVFGILCTNDLDVFVTDDTYIGEMGYNLACLGNEEKKQPNICQKNYYLAASIIQSSVSAELMHLVNHYRKAKFMSGLRFYWDEIHQKFMPTEPSAMTSEMVTLFASNLQPGILIEKHIANLQSAKNKLNRAAAALFPEVHSKTPMFSDVVLTLAVINSVKEMYPLEHAVIMKDPKAAMNIEQTLDYIT